MGLLESIRRLFGRAESALNEADYAALDAVHQVEDRIDDATGGRFYDAVERADEEAGELLDRLHLDDEPGEADKRSDAGSDAVDEVKGTVGGASDEAKETVDEASGGEGRPGPPPAA